MDTRCSIAKGINAFEMNFYRKLSQIPCTAHRTNDSIKEELTQKIRKVEMLISIIRKQQLKWFGRVMRHNDTLPFASNIMHGRAPGMRDRGRRSVSWIQNITNYTKLLAIEAV